MFVNKDHSLILALELSQREGSVAARLGSGEIVEVPALQGDRNADSVMPAIDSAVTRVGGVSNIIGVVIVSVGPGGFTGLRVAVATAKMISLATGATIVPVETAMGVVHGDLNAAGKSLVISCVKNNTFWISEVHSEQKWACKGKLVDIDEVDQYLDSTIVLYGDSFLPEEVRRTCKLRGIPVRPFASSASSILEVGLALLAAGKTIDPNELLPLYPREPEAVRKWNEIKN